MKTEAKVGLFVAIGLLFLFLLSTQVNRFANVGKKGYEIYALLDDASGLEKNAKVRIKGVDVGFVKDMKLEGTKVKVTLFIFEGVKIPKDSVVVLKQQSLLGSKFLDIEPGNSSEYLSAGETLERQKRFASFDETSTTISEAAEEFRAFIADLRESIAGSSGEDLKKSVENLRAITADIKELIRKNSDNITKSIENIKIMGEKLAAAGEKFGRMSDKFAYTADSINKELPKILKRVDDLTLYLRDSSKDLKQKLPTLMDKFAAIEDELQSLIKENKKPLNSAIKSADKFFSSGGESFKKLDKYLSSIGKSQIEMDFRSYYMSKDDYNKNTFSLSYIPVPNKYYILEVVSGDDFSRTDANGNVILPKKHEESKYYVSALYARRYGDLRFRLGLIENTGGGGIDYYLFNDQGKLSMDLYDFNAVNDVRGSDPHLSIYYRQRFLKHLDAYIGADNILNAKARNYLFGLGLNFVDQDMKYLLGTVSGAGSFIK
ncbi:MAG: hypothetical protein C6H99_01835 [Epsilonproteobacteria bacterium]|nr:hypothetical protein [Campylobacterota bacterium]NPA63397.1 MCE family protein [Campylobacterota bacterium]